MTGLLTIVLDFLRFLVMYAIAISVPLSTPLSSVLHGFNYTLTNTTLNNTCNVQIAAIYPKNGLFVKSVEVFVSPSYITSYNHQFMDFIKKLLSNHVRVFVVKLSCYDYPHLNDTQVRRILNKYVKADLCYGWGPEALYCQCYSNSTKILDNPMGGYEYLSKFVKEFGIGGYFALAYLLKTHHVIKAHLAEGIYVNGTLAGFSDSDVPTLAWFNDLPTLLINNLR